jgi:hypothetical protein
MRDVIGTPIGPAAAQRGRTTFDHRRALPIAGLVLVCNRMGENQGRCIKESAIGAEIERLSDRYGHPGQTERDLEADLDSLKSQDDASGVLQRCHLAAADECGSGTRAAITAGNVPRIVQIGCSAHEIHRGNAKRADADAADAQPVSMSVVDQGAAAAAGADDEAGFDDMQTDRTGLRAGLRRRSDQRCRGD